MAGDYEQTSCHLVVVVEQPTSLDSDQLGSDGMLGSSSDELYDAATMRASSSGFYHFPSNFNAPSSLANLSSDGFSGLYLFFTDYTRTMANARSWTHEKCQ